MAVTSTFRSLCCGLIEAGKARRLFPPAGAGRSAAYAAASLKPVRTLEGWEREQKDVPQLMLRPHGSGIVKCGSPQMTADVPQLMLRPHGSFEWGGQNGLVYADVPQLMLRPHGSSPNLLHGFDRLDRRSAAYAAASLKLEQRIN